MGRFVVVVALALIAGASAQRVAPGVPPQQYQPQQHPQHHQQQPQFQQQQQHMQQNVPPGQYQQQPPQFQQQQVPPGVHPGQYQQQQPMHQQQVPVQHQQQVPVQHQQVPVQPQHQVPPQQQGHHAPHHAPQGFNPGHIDEHERQHIQEHAEVPIDTSKMTEQELQFHYFKMHDSDHNNKLDGCELIKSLIHYHEQGSKEGHDHGEPEAPKVEEKIFSDEELVALIDPILQMDDMNRDGFIDYPEFIRAQQKAAQKN